MAIAISNSRSGASVRGQAQTPTITGLTAATKYVLTLKYPNGQTSDYPITSDGSGNATMPKLPIHERGTYTLDVYLAQGASLATFTWGGV